MQVVAWITLVEDQMPSEIRNVYLAAAANNSTYTRLSLSLSSHSTDRQQLGIGRYDSSSFCYQFTFVTLVLPRRDAKRSVMGDIIGQVAFHEPSNRLVIPDIQLDYASPRPASFNLHRHSCSNSMGNIPALAPFPSFHGIIITSKK